MEPIQTWLFHHRKELEYLVCGGAAGAVSRTLIAPIERVKIIYQINSARQMQGYGALFAELVRREGLAALWRGNSAAVLRVVPYMAVQFLTFEKAKERLSASPLAAYGFSQGSPLLHLVSGSTAGATAVLLTYPLDFARAQLAMQTAQSSSLSSSSSSIPSAPPSALISRYKGPLDVLINHPRKYGVASLYSGIAPSLSGIIPYAGIKFSIYEAIKGLLREAFQVDEQHLPVPARMLCAASAGFVAQTSLYPLDIVRRRMQTADALHPPYSSTLQALSEILRTEGVRRGLYRGLSLNLLKVCILYYLFYFIICSYFILI